MLCLMDDSKERGYLIEDGIPWPDEDVAAAVGGDKVSALACIEELCAKSVAPRDSRGALYSRVMVNESHISETRRNAGAKGSFATAKGCQNSHPPPSKPLISYFLILNSLLPEEFLESEEFWTSWLEWETYRSKTKKKLSEFAVRKQAEHIVKEGWDVQRTIAAINHSIRNDWQGLFEPGSPKQPDSPARVRGTETSDAQLTIHRPTD